MTTDKPDLSVVLLCYRSENAIPSYVEELILCLNELKIDWEIILVANYIAGSNDPSPEIARNIANHDSRIKAITQEKAGMMGWDMKSGFQVASGKVIAVTDGDGQFPLSDVGKIYTKLIDENLDMAKTYRIKNIY